jgi:UDP-glucose 4-epimerase
VKKILITGGCGFIGSNLIPLFIGEGYRVSVLDNFSNVNSQYIDKFDVEIIKGDIRDKVIVKEAISGTEGIIHLAASGSVIESVRVPFDNFDNNVVGTFTLLDECRKQNISNFIFASTGGALIGNAEPPVNEQSLPSPISPYGSSKLCCEAYCSSFSSSYDMNITALRFANVVGKNSLHKKGAVNAFMNSILDETPITIYGDGTATRDFLYANDLCLGILEAFKRNLKGFNRVHLASGQETSVKELAEIIVSISGQKGYPINYLPIRKGEVEKNFATFDYAKQVLNFEPKTSLKDALSETWDWVHMNRTLS